MSAVIEQLFRSSLHRIKHATCRRMIPGFAHLRPKEAFHIDFYLKNNDFLLHLSFLFLSEVEKKKLKAVPEI